MGERLAAQMSSYEVLPGVFVDGQNTITETMADLGGLHIAYEAYRRSLKGKEAPIIDGYTGDQRFFLAFAQNWRAKLRNERLKQDTQGGDSHPISPIRPRMVRNMDAWYQAFDVKPGEKLYLKPEDRLSIW
jgi:putative endopeptidase